MKNFNKQNILKYGLLALTVNAAFASGVSNAKENTNAFYGDFRLRYENVSQDNALQDADALTLRSRLGFKTKTIDGFSALIEIENNIELIDDFSVPPTGDRTGKFSVVADPESTEIDQAFVSYSSDTFKAKVGRQVITLDGHRFVGHVGWRQDRQTFDAAVFSYTPVKGFQVSASYIDKRNRIFADERDIDSKDLILNTSYKVGQGKLVAYAYLLEMDNATDNSLDTYGISYKGSSKLGDNKILYAAEYATQETNDVFDTDYVFLEGGATLGGITAKLGYESLGSDGGLIGFATPLATLHKFNGWADQFLATPAQGLDDIYLTLSGTVGGGKWVATYHDYSSDVALNGADDLGDEINLLYSRKFGDGFSGGVKFADYTAGDSSFSKVDSKKVWIWAGFKF